MKNQSRVTIGGHLERDAIRILRDVPGVEVETSRDRNDPADITIRAGEVTQVIQIKTSRSANAASAAQLIGYIDALPGRDEQWVLVAGSITEDARRLLTEAGVGFMDTTGAMSVNIPGLYVSRDGRRDAHRSSASPRPNLRLAGKAGTATQALLADPNRHWKVNDLASAAGVSTGLAHRLFVRLESDDLVQVEGAGPQKVRQLSNPTALLDLWAEETRDRGVREFRAYRLARDPRTQARSVSQLLTAAKIDHAVTGAAAAAQLAPVVTAIPVTDIWVPELYSLKEVATAAGADEVNEGHNIAFRQAKDDTPLTLRTQRGGIWLANRFRIFIDLRADPRRGREQAARIRQEVIGF